ncbi:hypothetical protein KSS87_016095 [Heliosperma pusillum]|nr:hypothetical protein KSS87_016095 [Heliosperma pusillum]
MTFLLLFYKFYKYWTSIFLLLPFLVLSTTYTSNAHNLTKQTLKNSNNISNIQAVLVFGDSTVDPGNNNFINTMFRGDFPPYGVDYPNHIPTGRFTNGKLATDLIASYAGIKQLIPAYLDPSLSLDDLKTGVSFASAGTGFDPATAARSGVIDMSKQLQYLDEYKIRIKSFDKVDNGCCGTGLLEVSFMCNSMIDMCNDRSKYIFWDSIHPTERSYSLLFESLCPILDSILGKL